MIKWKKKRELHYDILKAICVCAVVILHVNATVIWDENDIIIHNLINYFTRFAVPCFFMISGAFMMNSSKNFKDIMVTVVYKLLIPFVAMTVVWMVALLINSNGKELWNNVINPLLICNYGALWFIPSICLLYILTPLLRSVVKFIPSSKHTTILVCYLLWTIVSAIVSDNYAPYSISAICMFAVYYVCGGYIYHLEVKKLTLKAFSLITVVFSITALILRIKGFDIYMYDAYKSYFSPAVVIMSIFIFLLIRYIAQNHYKVNDEIAMISMLIAKYSIYIYLLHRLIVIILVKIFERYFTNNTLAIIIIVSVLSIIVSLLLGMIWSVIRKTIDRKLKIKSRINTIVESMILLR